MHSLLPNVGPVYNDSMSFFRYVLLAVGYLWDAGTVTFSYILILLGPGLVLAFLMHHVSRFVATRFRRLPVVGWVFYPLFVGWLGIVFHELSHTFFAVIFRHEITRLKLFDIRAEDGAYGTIETKYDPSSFYEVLGTFFVGTAPILLAPLAIYAASRYLVGSQVFQSVRVSTVDFSQFSSFEAFGGLFRSVFNSTFGVIGALLTWENFKHLQFYIFLYIALSIGSAITLSRADIREAAKGFKAFVALVFLMNLSTLWITNRFADPMVELLGQACGSFYAIMLFALIINLIFAVLVAPLSILI